MAPFSLRTWEIEDVQIKDYLIIIRTYIYNLKWKVKVETGHIPPKFGRVMALFTKNLMKQCPVTNSWQG